MLRFLLLPAALLLTTPAFAAPDISVTAAPNEAGWDITLSPEIADTVISRMWLVIDGKSEILNTEYFSSAETHKPLRFQAKADSTLDDNVKDILKAQGLSTKPNVTTYFISYRLNGSSRFSVPETLHFAKMQTIQIYTMPPPKAIYKAGDRITLYGVVALNEGMMVTDIDLPPGVRINDAPIPTDTFSDSPDASASEGKVHRIYIQVQFVPKPANSSGKSTQ